MWISGWRDEVWRQMDVFWDILIIGGGITGAGIFNQAARSGLKVLLVEANDFAFGTSSRSSKLVHGGFRYLRNRQFGVTREAVRERERLLRQGGISGGSAGIHFAGDWRPGNQPPGIPTGGDHL